MALAHLDLDLLGAEWADGPVLGAPPWESGPPVLGAPPWESGPPVLGAPPRDTPLPAARRTGGRAAWLGATDLNSATEKMNGVRVVSVAAARTMLETAQKIIDETIAAGKGGWFSRSLPGETARKNVKGHLDWHAQRLSRLANPQDRYDAAEDLKKWVLQADIESNAIEDGRASRSRAMMEMFTRLPETKYANDFVDKVARVVGPEPTPLPEVPAEEAAPTSLWWKVGGATGVVGAVLLVRSLLRSQA